MEPGVPAIIGKHHDRVLASALFFRSKIATEQRPNAESRKQVLGYDTAGESLRDGSIIGVVEKVLPSGSGDLLIRLTLFSNGLVFGGSRSVLVAILFNRPNMNEALRLPKWQGSQQGRVHQTENCRIRADPKGETDGRDYRKSWILPKLA
jgi:hypothetical protein